VRAIRLRRPKARLLVAIVLLAAALTGGWLWLRDSSLTRVRTVTVTGATSTAGPKIRDALESAAQGMTTLHVRQDALVHSVAGFPSVAALRVRADFPHRLVVEVVERKPVAVVAAGDQMVAVTGGGLLLRDVGAPDTVPEIDVRGLPGGERLNDPRTLGALAVAAAAPPALAKRTISIGTGPRGLHAKLESGPPLIFGSSQDAAAKWAGAARVLADPSSAGATYLDLRIPGRVAAGGIGPLPETAPDDPSAPVTQTLPTTPPPNAQP
jgi:cell division protein FtsQ